MQSDPREFIEAFLLKSPLPAGNLALPLTFIQCRLNPIFGAGCLTLSRLIPWCVGLEFALFTLVADRER
jgi:hypothetical protein